MQGNRVYTFNVTHNDTVLEFPVYAREDLNVQHPHLYYVFGWPKALIVGALRVLAESSLHWNQTPLDEDDDYLYYSTRIETSLDTPFPEEELLKRFKFMWRRGQLAYSTAKNMARGQNYDVQTRRKGAL